MKNFAIVSGTFSAAGNFSGYDALGTRVHIRKAQMESLGFTSAETAKYPFYAVVNEDEINPRNDAGELMVDTAGNPVLVKRLTAKSVFANKAALVEARAEVATLDIEVQAAVQQKAKAAGLTDQQIAAIAAVSL